MVTNLSVYPGCFFLFSCCFWGKYSNSLVWNDIGRNCLLRHGKKRAKFLIGTFTFCSTFLYGLSSHLCNYGSLYVDLWSQSNKAIENNRSNINELILAKKEIHYHSSFVGFAPPTNKYLSTRIDKCQSMLPS